MRDNSRPNSLRAFDFAYTANNNIDENILALALVLIILQHVIDTVSQTLIVKTL